jgi:hypothetical protein
VTTLAGHILLCLAAMLWLLKVVRRDRASLGLPIASLFGLLLIHVPGAVAHLVGGSLLLDSDFTELGMRFTAMGAVSFVAGVWLAQSAIRKVPAYHVSNDGGFWMFCLAGGWFVTYGLSFLKDIPSIGAAVNKSGAIWMLGNLLGLRFAVQRQDLQRTILWAGALLVYPVLMLLLGGFLSYGSTAVIIVLSVLAVSLRGYGKTVVGIGIAAVMGLAMFLSYFQNRTDIRDAVWGGASIEKRVEVSLDMFKDFSWFDATDPGQLRSLDARLNQNFFVGLAAQRIQDGDVDYLYGRSIWQGLMALVPRIAWPDKPVFAGSPQIVAEMTGLFLNEQTSFGVGNVMEFQINFGMPGVIGGFLLLGWLIGLLDRKAAIAELHGDLGSVILFFLPAVALIQPNGSIVEMAGGAAASLVAAYGWRWIWNRRGRRVASRNMQSGKAPAEYLGRRL